MWCYGQGKIKSFSTSLTGEMIAALSKYTILKDIISLSVDEEYLLKGYSYCERNGINETLFKVRVLNKIFGCSEIQTYSFFVGAVLQAEIKKLLSVNTSAYVIGGKEQIKNAMYILLKSFTDKKVKCISAEAVDLSTVRGMIKIYEY